MRMQKVLVWVFASFLFIPPLPGGHILTRSVNLVTTVRERITAGFFDDMAGEESADLSFSRENGSGSTFLVINTNFASTMDIEAQLPPFRRMGDKKETMPYTTTVRLISGGGRFALFGQNDVAVLENSDAFQTFGRVTPGTGSSGVFSFVFSVDPLQFDKAFGEDWRTTVNVQLSNPQ